MTATIPRPGARQSVLDFYRPIEHPERVLLGAPIVKCPRCGGMFSGGSTFREHQLERHPSPIVEAANVGDALEAIRRATP